MRTGATPFTEALVDLRELILRSILIVRKRLDSTAVDPDDRAIEWCLQIRHASPQRGYAYFVRADTVAS